MHYLAKSFHSAPVIALLSALLALAPAARLAAQAVPGPPVPAGTEVEEEIIEMSPFDVVAQTKDDSRYETSRTNAITGTALPLERVPMSAQIFNRNFIEDMGITDIGDALVKYAGFDPQMTNFNGSGALSVGNEAGDRNDFANLQVRGLPAGVQRRDGFLNSIGSGLDAFDIESFEAINGSQSLIYGAGDAGGVLNMVGRRAKFRSNYGRARFQFNSNGTRRYTLETNLGNRRFAVTAVGVKGTQEIWKVGLPRESEGWFAGVAVQPTNWLTVRGEYRRLRRTEINAYGSNLNLPEIEGLPYFLRPSTKAADTDTAVRDLITGDIITVNGAPADAASSDETKIAARKAGGMTNTEMSVNNWRFILWNMGGGYMGFDWDNIDSIFGMYARDIKHEYGGVSVEARVTRNFHLQFRWGRDDYHTHALEADGTHQVFHPEYPNTATVHKPDWAFDQWAYRYTGGNNYLDAVRQDRRQKGFRVMGNYIFNTGRFAQHRLTFSWQTLDSTQRQVYERWYEVDPETGEFLTVPFAALTSAAPVTTSINYTSTVASTMAANYWTNAGRKAWAHPSNSTGGLTDAGSELWIPIYNSGPSSQRWPFNQFSIAQADGTTRVFRLAPVKLPGWETPELLRAAGLSEADIATRMSSNPLGLNNTTYSTNDPVTGRKTISGIHRILEIDEDAYAASLTSEWLADRVTTMFGYRLETFTVHRLNDGMKTGPSTKTSFTAGALVDIAKWGRDNLSAYVSFSSNTKAMTDLEKLDIHGETLPFEKGLSKEIGFKFSLFNRRISGGNIFAYQTNVKNTPIDLGSYRDSLDPVGLNGSHVPYVPYAVKDMESEGIGLSFFIKPIRGLTLQFSYRHSDGRNSGADIRLPYYYNDQFHTAAEGYETYVIGADGNRIQIKENPVTDTTAPGPGDPYLTLGRMKDPDSYWYYDKGRASGTDYGRISNTSLRDKLREAGAGTGATGLPVTQNQFGVELPEGNDTYLLSAAGEKRPNTTVHSFNINATYDIPSGWFKGLSLGAQFNYRHDIRAHWYYDQNEVVNDTLAVNAKQRYARKLALEPDQWYCDLSAIYIFKLTRRVTWGVAVNITNVFDRWKLYPLQMDMNEWGHRLGQVVSARPLYSPRTISVSNSVRF
jgi:hypothetical protein